MALASAPRVDSQRARSLVSAWLQRLAPVPPAEADAFVTSSLSVRTYRPKERFAAPGDVEHRVGFIVSGLFRVYYTGRRGAQHVRNFCLEGAPIGAYGTALTGEPVNVSIEALEDAVVLETLHATFARQLERSAAWERFGRRVAEAHYVARERREQAFLTLDARQRLQRFHADFPGLAARVKVADVASYIGVRPETLSRMRARRVADG